MRAVTAMLLSARFPIVSPSGALLRCVRRNSGDSAPGDPIVTYAVDGGYYENSGLLSLLQIWDAVEPLVAAHNDTSSWKIVPWVVLIDNHYRSEARAAPHDRPLELVVPLKAVSNNAVFSQAALEQMAALAMGHGPCTKDRSQAARKALNGPEDNSGSSGEARSAMTAGCFLVIAPFKKPSVAAPLGWVLSDTTINDLKTQLADRVQRKESESASSVCELRRQLG